MNESERREKVEGLLALHRPGDPLLLPNPWDLGSARLFASIGYHALATTSSGHAGTLGRRDGRVSRDEALAHARAIADATSLPVSADLENGFGDDPQAVAATVREAAAVGLSGCSVEDHPREGDLAIYPLELAAERVAAAAEVARAPASRLVLTARAENFLHGRRDLADTIERLQAFQEAGADCLYAPGLSDPGQIESVVRAVDRPVNVLLRPNGPSVARLAAAGVARISLGGTFYRVALGAAREAARELLEAGTTGFFRLAESGSLALRDLE